MNINKPRDTILVKIHGNVSSGKSTWANLLSNNAYEKGYTVYVSDHDLFEFEKKCLCVKELCGR